MAVVLDTSGLVAALDTNDPHHSEAVDQLMSESGPRILSPFVLAEVDYLIAKRSLAVELRVLRDVAAGAYDLVQFSPDDVEHAASLVEKYRDLGIGLADASIVIVADRAGTKRIVTLDERHFRALRPLSGGHFTLLPADT